MGTQQVDSKVYRFIILILLSTFLLSCSTTVSKISKTSVQPGEVIQRYLMNNNKAETDLVTALKKIPNKNKAGKLATDNPHIISELYSADILKVVIDGGLNTSTLATELKSLSDTDKAVDVLVLLFPIDAYRLLGYSKDRKSTRLNSSH